MQKTKSIALILGVLAMSILVGYFVLAWTEPGSIPPVGNVPAPLNVSLNAQSKEGALVVGANSSVTTGLIVRYGNVGIGTTSPGEKLDIQGGNVKINTFRVKPVSATELGVYDSTNSLIVIFDEGN